MFVIVTSLSSKIVIPYGHFLKPITDPILLEQRDKSSPLNFTQSSLI